MARRWQGAAGEGRVARLNDARVVERFEALDDGDIVNGVCVIAERHGVGLNEKYQR